MIPTRLIIVKRGCPFCLKAIKAVLFVNMHLPDDRMIKVVDNYEWEEFGFKSHPIMDRFDPKTFDGYPFIFIDGIEIIPTETDLLIISIAKIVEDDLISPIIIGEVTIY